MRNACWVPKATHTQLINDGEVFETGNNGVAVSAAGSHSRILGFKALPLTEIYHELPQCWQNKHVIYDVKYEGTNSCHSFFCFFIYTLHANRRHVTCTLDNPVALQPYRDLADI